MFMHWQVLAALAVSAAPPTAPPNDLHGDPLPAGALARLGTIRFRHAGFRSKGVAFSRDGQTLVAGGEGNVIRVFHATTGRPLRVIPLGKFNISGFALSPDGKLAAVSGAAFEKEDQLPVSSVRLIDLTTGKNVRSLARKGLNDHFSLAFTPDGKHLASVANDGVVRVEEVATGTELLQERFRTSYPELSFSADGSALAVGGSHTPVAIWEWQSGLPPREIKVPPRGATSVSFSPDGKVLATGDDTSEGVRLWDVATGKLLRTLRPAEGSNMSRVCFSPDGRYLASSNYSPKGVILWDAATGKEVRRIDNGERYPGALAFSGDSRQLAVLDEGGPRVWDVATGKETSAPAGHRRHPSHVVLLGDGTAMTAADDGMVFRWDAATGKPLRSLRASDHWVRGAAITPDGRWLATSTLGEDHSVSLWDARAGKLVYRQVGHGQLGGFRGVAFSLGGKRFLSWGDDMYLRAWEVRNGKATAEHAIRPDGAEPPDLDDPAASTLRMGRWRSGVFSPGGELFVLGGHDGFFVFDTATGKQVKKIAREQGHVAGAAVSPDGKLLLASTRGQPRRIPLAGGGMRSASSPGAVTLHDLATGKPVRQLPHALPNAGPVAFSADGKRFAAASSDETARISIHDTATGSLIGAIDGVPSRVWSLGLSPDGRRVIAGLEDTTALVWDVPEKEGGK